MKTQQDSKVRIVAVENLKAMCRQASGGSHIFTVSKVSRSRVHVEYSHRGSPDPITAVFPCYPSPWPEDSPNRLSGDHNGRVVLDPLRVFGGREEVDREIGWQAIEGAIVQGATLYRRVWEWESHRQMIDRGTADPKTADPSHVHGCVVCDAR